MCNYSSKNPRLKLLRGTKVTDSCFRSDGFHFKIEFGVPYVNRVFGAVKRCLDRGGIASLSNSLERDIK